MVDYDEYFSNLDCKYWGEFDNSYRYLNVNGKIVIIVGNDCGSTALYFLMKGAVRIIGYEKDEKLNEIFKNKVCVDFNICDRVELRGEWKGDEYPDGDVFVMDCEGCESKLDMKRISKYEQYCIGVHDWTENRVQLLRELQGTKFTFVSNDGKEITLCR